MLKEMLEWGATLEDLLVEYGVTKEEVFEENEK